MKKIAFKLALTVPLLCSGGLAQDWISLFDGKTMNGWQPSEHQDTWKVEDGLLVSRGERSHLFYTGEVSHHEFKNFEFQAEVKTQPGANSGIYLHTHYQESGFPATGYECQVINSNPEVAPGQYVEHKMTASIYAIRNVWKSPAKDNEWFRYRVVVQGKTMRTYINDELMTEYTEPEHAFRPSDKPGRLLGAGTFALQGHDGGSVVFYRNLKVKPLLDSLATPGSPPDDLAFEAKIIQLANDNFPLLDLHVQLNNGLTLERALANSRKYGYTYGIVCNGPPPAGFRKPPQSFLGLQIHGLNALHALSADARANFDFVSVDVPTLAAGIDKIEEGQNYVDQLIGHIQQIAATKSVNIVANLTALPELLSNYPDAFWSSERMDRVIRAIKAANVAVEINDRLKLPSAAFIKRAKAAGVRFTFGSDNTGPNDLGRLSYGIAMVEACQLRANDLWWP